MSEITSIATISGIHNMTLFQDLFEKQIQEIPHLILESLIEKKLAEHNINVKAGLAGAIAKHILIGNSESFKWDDGDLIDSKISLEFSDEDFAIIKDKVERVVDSIPSLVESVFTEISEIILSTLKENWQEECRLQKKDCDDFRTRLEGRWGEAIGLLRMLLTICREIGGEAHSSNLLGQSQRSNLLIRLHTRACQVTAEIISLLENGFADGAMARWRTLHEINVVMTLIKEHDEELAERYLAHRAIEAKSSKDQYELCYEQLGYMAISKVEGTEIDEGYKKAINKYGKQFGAPYGWAAKHIQVDSGRLGFGDLETAAGRASMGSHYKLASHNVHAGPHALFFRLGLIDDSILLAGASNAGLIEPGQNTAVSLTSITFSLIGGNIGLDAALYMKILLGIRDEIPAAFARADSKLQKDHLHLSRTKGDESI